MQPSPALSNNQRDYLMLMMAYRSNMISGEQVRMALGLDLIEPMVESAYDIPPGCICHGDGLYGMHCDAPKHATLRPRTYEERRARLLDLCGAEGTDTQLHNDIVAELLQYMSGDEHHSCEFGNTVAEIYQIVEQTGMTVEAATFHLMCKCGIMKA